MPRTVRECDVEKGAPEPPATARSSTGKEPPINTSSLLEGRQGEKTPLRWPVDTASMVKLGIREQGEKNSVQRRASASNATAATTPSSSGTVARRASASKATISTPASSSGATFFESFDDSRYWDYAYRFTQRQDIGNKCRECKRPFQALKEEIVVRRYVDLCMIYTLSAMAFWDDRAESRLTT